MSKWSVLNFQFFLNNALSGPDTIRPPARLEQQMREQLFFNQRKKNEAETIKAYFLCLCVRGQDAFLPYFASDLVFWRFHPLAESRKKT